MTLAQPEFAIAHRSRHRLTLVSPTSSPTPTLRVVIAGGSTLLRVTGVAPVGIPQDDVFVIAENLAGLRNP